MAYQDEIATAKRADDPWDTIRSLIQDLRSELQGHAERACSLDEQLAVERNDSEKLRAELAMMLRGETAVVAELRTHTRSVM